MIFIRNRGRITKDFYRDRVTYSKIVRDAVSTITSVFKNIIILDLSNDPEKR